LERTVTVADNSLDRRNLSSDPSRVPAVPTGHVPPQDVHILRLCLDLQLDALLHTVGASAAARVSVARGGEHSTETPVAQRGSHQPAIVPHTYSGVVAAEPERGHRPDPLSAAAANTPLPWRRWLSEDVELACAMAAASMASDALPPAELGTDLVEADPVEVVDDLLVRYRSMQPMLTGLAQGAMSESEPWRALLRSTLDRCEQRIQELQHHRDDLVLAGAPAAPSTGWAQAYHVPGDYLG
jgi:hypothetical protein